MIANDNDPELSGKYLGTITSDFAKISEVLKEASYSLRNNNATQFPIFIFSKLETKIGTIFIRKEEIGINWNINASLIEEFVQRGLIDAEKQDGFKEVYKNPDEFCCLFVMDGEFTRFIFLPFPDDTY